MKKKLVILMLVMYYFSNAQITTSNVSGFIKNAAGKPIAGATVMMLFDATNTKYNIKTDDRGSFHIYNMNAGGPYILRINLIGYKLFEKKEIYLSLGNTNDYEILLEEEVTALKEVTVTSTNKKLSNGISIGEEKLKTIPTLSRALTDFTKLVPQNVNNSFAGTNFRYNNVTIDGTINNDAIGFSPSLGGQSGSSGMPGSSTRTSPISIDAIKDIQVYIAPFDVKLGNFVGGSINAITRSGTNEIKGSIYMFGRNATLTGFNTTNEYNDYQIGGRIGLPIVKDKFFLFTNLEFTNRTEPIFYGTNSSGLINDSTAKKIADFVQSKYNNFNVGSYDKYTINNSSTKIFNRLDWNLNDNNQLTLRNNTIFSEATNLERDGANFRFGSMDFKQMNNQSSTVLELKTHFKKSSNSLIIGYTNIHDYRTPTSNNVAFPQVEISHNGGTILFGNEREATIFNLRQKTFEITDNYNWAFKNHSFTLGTHNELYTIDYGFVNSWNGRVSYKSLTDFFDDKPNRVRGFYSLINNDRDALFNNPYAQFNINLWSAYFQDEINLKNIKISVGLRLDYTDLPNKPTLSDSVKKYFPQYTNNYFNNLNFSPRIGFNWDVKGDKSFIIRGGTGIFVGRIPFAWLGYAYYNDGKGFGSFDLNNRANANNNSVDPLNGSKNFAFINGQKNQVQVDLLDNNFKMPQVWRTNIAVDKTIQGYKITVEGLFTQIIHDLKFQQINFVETNPIYYSYDVNKQNPIYSGAKVNNYFSNVYLLSNTNQGYKYSISTTINKRYKFGLDLYAAYTFGSSFDITNGIRNSMESNWQLNQSLSPNNPNLSSSNFDIKNRIVAQLTYRIKLSQFSLVFNSQSGAPFSWGIINTAIDNSPQAVSLVYIFKDITEATKYIPNATQAQAFMDYVISDEYLSSRKGNFTERNQGRTPWSTTADFKFVQTFKFHKKEIQLSLDILNLTNLINKSWGSIYFVPNTFNSTSTIGLALLARPSSPSLDPTFTFAKPTSTPYSIDQLASNWQMQIGIRYSF